MRNPTRGCLFHHDPFTIRLLPCFWRRRRLPLSKSLGRNDLRLGAGRCASAWATPPSSSNGFRLERTLEQGKANRIAAEALLGELILKKEALVALRYEAQQRGQELERAVVTIGEQDREPPCWKQPAASG
jgi:hypothetical protein